MFALCYLGGTPTFLRLRELLDTAFSWNIHSNWANLTGTEQITTTETPACRIQLTVTSTMQLNKRTWGQTKLPKLWPKACDKQELWKTTGGKTNCALLYPCMYKSGCIIPLFIQSKDYCSIDTKFCLPTLEWKHHLYRDGRGLVKTAGQLVHPVRTVPHVKANVGDSTTTQARLKQCSRTGTAQCSPWHLTTQ